MSLPPSARRAALFLLALALPSAGVLALGLRAITQERELASRRAVEDRQREVAGLRDGFVADLGRAARDALNRPAASAASPVALVAPVHDDALQLPWEGPATGTVAISPDSAPSIDEGERLEFGAGRLDAAAVAYARALAASRTTTDAATAQLHLARVNAAGGHLSEATSGYRHILAMPSTLTDDARVPFAYYAADRLLALGSDHNALAARLVADSDARVLASLAPAAVYKLRGLLDAAGLAAGSRDRDAASARVARQIEFVERALAVARDFPAIAARLAAGGAPRADDVWVAYGKNPVWLVTVTKLAGDGQAFVAVDARAAISGVAGRMPAAGRARLLLRSDALPTDVPLGAALPDMAVRFPSTTNAFDSHWRTQRTFYLAALGLVLGVTAVGGYLLWRDVRREVRLAETRALFVANVSHELKTPLTSIRMFAETLLARPQIDAAGTEEYLGIIVNESERLTRLLNNVLDVSRIERGEKTYHPQPASLTAVVLAAARSLAYSASSQGVDLDVATPDHPCVALVDADAIQQAVLNLLGNAIKYAGEARKVAVRLSAAGDRATIEVRDWGPGITADEHSRIFDTFYRVPTGENRSIPGTGLGLALVAHIVRAHAGCVRVESRPGQGSRFTIELPLEHTAALPRASEV